MVSPIAATSARFEEVSDWLDELERIGPSVSLPVEARLALISTIDAFAAEDGVTAQRAARVRARLAVISTLPRRA
jgi:hypothetical protein